MTIHGVVTAARQELRAVGIPPDEADLDARLLAQELLGWDAARYFTSGNEPAPAGFAEPYQALVTRRATREPIAYIIGRRDFWELTFEVSPAVLVPRPETESIVEVALELFPDRAAPLLAADVCTGSGCLAVTLAHARTHARFTATDVSAEALAVARRNAARHHVDDRVHVVQADLLTCTPGPFDLIVANPPYVPDGDRATLAPEVRDHEPAVALYGGRDGLDVVRRLIEQAAGRLGRHGMLVFEFGVGQADAVGELISAAPGLKMIGIRRDLQDIPRTAIATRA